MGIILNTIQLENLKDNHGNWIYAHKENSLESNKEESLSLLKNSQKRAYYPMLKISQYFQFPISLG